MRGTRLALHVGMETAGILNILCPRALLRALSSDQMARLLPFVAAYAAIAYLLGNNM